MTPEYERLRQMAILVRHLLSNAPEELRPAILQKMPEVIRVLSSRMKTEKMKAQQPESTQAPSSVPEQMQFSFEQAAPTNAAPSSPAQPTSEQLQPPVSHLTKELWNLSRQNPDIFSAYLSSYPDARLNSIASNPQELNSLIGNLYGKVPAPDLQEKDNFIEAPLQSSNVYGFRYDPLKKDLTVRFQGGSVYKYSQVPPVIFDMFAHGDGVAKTEGKNKWGKWWVGKTPSLGAALHQLIQLGGYDYRKVR